MSEARAKRPRQITNLAIAWTFFGLWNLWNAFQGISADLEIWDLLTNPMLPEWFRLAIPVELAIGIAILVAALIQLVTVALLLVGSPSSVKLALGVFVSIVMLNLVSGSLYASAPPEIRSELGTDILMTFGLGIFQLIILAYFWRELNKPEVKSFLGQTKVEETIREEIVTENKEKKANAKPKFYCRYCGSENKRDAIYCDSCGRQLKES
jgi:hypothetical protein